MNKYVKAAHDAKAAAKACIKEARKGNDCYYRHRDVELVPCSANGERCHDGSAEADYYSLKELSGKRIEQAVEDFKKSYSDFTQISICGGVDCFESLAVFFESQGDEYDPCTDSWDIEDLIS